MNRWLKTLILSVIIMILYLLLSFVLFGFSTTIAVYNDNLYLYFLVYLLSFAQSMLIIDMIYEF